MVGVRSSRPFCLSDSTLSTASTAAARDCGTIFLNTIAVYRQWPIRAAKKLCIPGYVRFCQTEGARQEGQIGKGTWNGSRQSSDVKAQIGQGREPTQLGWKGPHKVIVVQIQMFESCKQP